MMEVKHNTAVDLNDLLTSPKNIGGDEVDDVMTDLQERTAHNLVNCDLIKKNDETNLKIDEIENGDADMTSLDVDVGVDLNTTVNSELEDALLAEDDVLPEIPNTKTVVATSSTTDDILTEKAETSNSTSSSNARDPGDDLDTLLSKINDIVEDCIQNERENTISDTRKTDETTNKVVETEKNTNLNDESVTVMEDTSVTDETNLIEKEKVKEPVTNNIEEELLHSDANENITDKDALISSNLPQTPQEVVKNVEEVTKNEKSELDKGEKVGLELETETTKTSNDTVACESTDIDNDNNTKENNLSVEKKTEESNTEIVQDSKITSNSSEVIEAIKTTGSAESVENSDTVSSPKTFSTDEIEKTSQSNQESTTTLKKEPSESKEETRNANDTVTSVNTENDDSDDEIVFYVDKPPEVKKTKDTEAKSLDAGVDTATATKKSVVEKETSSTTKKTARNDDDVVLLLDDDDEEVNHVKRQESEGKDFLSKSANDEKEHDDSITSNVCTEEKNLVTDNSDNARDVFATDNSNENEKPVNKTEDIETPEDINSNCSSSSNLLQEAKSVKNTVDEPTLDEAENEDEEDDGDVELIESELKESETSDKADDSETAPPAKRIRLSEDSEEISKKHETSGGETDEVEPISDVDKKQESREYQENLEKENSCTETHAILKRSHDVIEIEGDEKSNDSKIYSEGSSKKQKTDILEDVVISDIVGEIGNDKETDDIKYMEDVKKSIKAVPSYEPIRLYPAPKFGILKTELPISLDFLKKFRKSFDNMTKNDLEDLVLQKVVEAIIHRSEFSEMRELIEKQEKVINAHRTKISELSKQFRDLEMVHNRVVKDIEQRNSQFIMPVKITRAVGLQVYIPNKKSLADPPTSSTGPNVPSSPQRSVSSQGSSNLNTSITPPQRLLLSSQTDTMQQRATGTTTSGPANTSTVRRGCVQKITPIRPVPGANQPATTASAPITSVSYRNTPTLSVATQPRILNKNATNTSNASAIQRSRYLGSTQESQQRLATQQPISRTPNIPANSQRLVTNATTQSKPTSSIASSVQRRSEPLTSQAANSSTSSIVDNYINTLTHLTGGNTAVSITPAKPKEKAVIDLTDEDETPGQSASAPPLAQIPGAQVSRRSLPVPSNSNTQLQYGRGAPSLGRVPPANQIANNKNRQMSLQGQNKNSFASISTPPGTSITRINVVPNATNSQRAKYGHPAPLPATPPQAFNPSWKLPPPRPTIRISNLDNGIVISWTMEESMDRHAECVSYQIYAYQETSGPPMVDSWRHVGDVKAMLLPMAVTLTQFQEGQRYYFAVRAVDCHQRCGPFSLPKTWS